MPLTWLAEDVEIWGVLVSTATISWSVPALMGSSAGGHIFDMGVSV